MNDFNQNRDPLTGLWKHRYAFEKLKEAVATCSQVALIFIDIDHLKSFNDQWNHNLGDERIIEIARGIEATVGDDCLACRYGGDEFLVIMPQCSLQKACEVAESLRAQRKPVFVTPDKTEVAALTLSLGLAHFPKHVSSAEGLIYAADLALLKAKRGGRLPDGTTYTGRNRVMVIGDFLDEFPHQSAVFEAGMNY
ncbi:MAG TPA: GGDEF domain-containing protein [Abditibacterium sp.]|jgi:diguanylate cyclase (GGDEF)-like protein